jgi:cytosine/adenosine deaminase-related metal-dependent hydrolase
MFSEKNQLISNRVVVTDKEGQILSIEHTNAHDPASVRFLDGILLPGFINTHCHLELSHMKDKVDTGTGLLPFIKNVVAFRNINQDIIDQAIRDGADEMYKNGIVAVGDISNKTHTAAIKSEGPLDYYTFVEMFDFLQPAMTNDTIAQYKSVMLGQSDTRNNRKSYVPHSPYTVSPELFRFINESNDAGATISIHNQETPAENELFYTATGGFTEFYKSFGFNLDHFKPLGKSSIYYILQHLDPKFRTLFVHNTLTNCEDVLSASKWNNNVFWATCPNANLYIENRLPDYKVFLDTGAKVTIGTDSLTSNWQLSIWEEIRTILRYQSFISEETVLQWATTNGAEALGFDDRLGSLSVGKTPGIVCLQGNATDFQSLRPVRII